MTDRREPRFKLTWPRSDGDTERDHDLKRPGRIDPALVQRLSRGAIAGPPARPARPRRRD